MLQTYIPFLPKGTQPINNHVAIYHHDEKIEFYTASGPIYACRESDMYAVRLAQGIIVTQTATTPAELAKALNVNRTTVYRNFKIYQQGGPAALIIDKKSNRNAYKLKGKAKGRVQTLLNKGYSLKAAAKQVGITEGCIRYAIKKGTIVMKKQREKSRHIRKLKVLRSVQPKTATVASGSAPSAKLNVFWQVPANYLRQNLIFMPMKGFVMPVCCWPCRP